MSLGTKGTPNHFILELLVPGKTCTMNCIRRYFAACWVQATHCQCRERCRSASRYDSECLSPGAWRPLLGGNGRWHFAAGRYVERKWVVQSTSHVVVI